MSGPASLVTATDVLAISTPPVAITDGAVSVVSRAASLPTATASNGGTAPVENFIDDEKACEQFIRKTCGCKKAPNNKPCSSLFSVQHYMDLRAQQLDMVFLGSLITTILDDTHAVKDGRHASVKRKKKCPKILCTMAIMYRYASIPSAFSMG